MFRKFVEGLVFGTGFAIAFVVVAGLLLPALHSTGFTTRSSIVPAAHSSVEGFVEEEGAPFHELPIEERIKKSSVIALARFEPSSDGKMKAVIKELLKKDAGTTLYYEIGDEYSDASYYPKEGRGYGDGVVIFFTGSPATVKMSMSYSGDRIHSLGDMPVELLRNKCRDDTSSTDKSNRKD